MIDSVTKATGQAKFTADLSLPGMLIGKLLRSPHPHARILNIDVSSAQKLTAVRAVVTGKDTAGKTYGSGAAFCDEQALAVDKVRFVGDEVAAVAAVDEDSALEALSLIKVDYEPLPAVFDPEEAMKPGAPSIHQVENNVSLNCNFNYGQVDEAFSLSERVFEDEFNTQGVAHCPLETRAALASADSSGKVTIWTSTQGPNYVRRDLAITLDIPLGQVRVIKPFVGGGFGGKREMLALEFCAALLSKKTSRPVKIAYHREEEFSATRRRHPMTLYIRTGMKKDGTILAKDCRVVADGGAYNGRGPQIVAAGVSWLNLVYRFQNCRYQGFHVYTNKEPASSMRGFGNTQVRFADDCQMEKIATELGIDPVELRLKNARQAGDVSPQGARVTSCGLSECLRQVAQHSQFKSKWGKLPRYRGIGAACAAYVSGSKQFFPHDSSSAFVQLIEDGTVCLLTGASDIGQGSNTVLAQIAAEELGIGLNDMTVISADTDVTPLDLGSYASRVTFIAGNAVKAAAADAKKQLLEVAAEKLEASPQDLEIKDHRIYVKGSPDKGISFKEMVRASLYSERGMPILGRGYYNPPSEFPDFKTGIGNRSPTYSFGAQVAEVEVNPETGQVKVIRITAAQDCGFALNPMSVEGQIEGSLQMGLGQAFYEDLKYDKGDLLTPSFIEYRMATALDMPEIQCYLVESIDPEGPFGAKGISEMPQVPTSPAIVNAIYNAIGVQIKNLPVTPEKILAALEKGK